MVDNSLVDRNTALLQHNFIQYYYTIADHHAVGAETDLVARSPDHLSRCELNRLGRKEGRTDGRREGRKGGRKDRREDGREDGRKEGRKDGRTEV